MMPPASQTQLPITTALLAFGATIQPRELFPVVVPEAADLALGDPYAFAIATTLDRGMKAELVWTIPYDIRTALGHLDPRRIDELSEEKLDEVFRGLPHRPRYINAAPRTLRELTRIVVQEGGGDASRLWLGKSAAAVCRTFRSIYGVGP